MHCEKTHSQNWLPNGKPPKCITKIKNSAPKQALDIPDNGFKRNLMYNSRLELYVCSAAPAVCTVEDDLIQ